MTESTVKAVTPRACLEIVGMNFQTRPNPNYVKISCPVYSLSVICLVKFILYSKRKP